MSEVDIRRIRREDDATVREIIIAVMTELEATGEGFGDRDPELTSMSEAYGVHGAAYFVVEIDGRVVGGGGFGPLAGAKPDVCELRKMYLLPECRGLGIGRRMLKMCLTRARELGYRTCYLETLAQMDRARDLYERFGFLPLEAPMGDTGHIGCNRWYALSL